MALQTWDLRSGKLLGIILTFGLILGCSSQRPAIASLAVAEYQVKTAVQSEAPRYAPRELAVAQEKLRLGGIALKEKNFVLARRLGEQAAVDANYAVAKGQAELAIEGVLHSYPANRTSRAEQR